MLTRTCFLARVMTFVLPAHSTNIAVKTTHNLWLIDELVRNILTQLPKGDSTLARCARVSRSLSAPALDILWYALQGVLPLLKLLPFPVSENDSYLVSMYIALPLLIR